MSMENTNTSYRPEDREAATGLVNEHPLLRHDLYAKRVVESGFADNGEPVDVGNFLAARIAFLEKTDAEVRLAAAEGRDKASYDAAVIHSVRPDLEEK
jgi:hypothetical protein